MGKNPRISSRAYRVNTHISGMDELVNNIYRVRWGSLARKIKALGASFNLPQLPSSSRSQFASRGYYIEINTARYRAIIRPICHRLIREALLRNETDGR